MEKKKLVKIIIAVALCVGIVAGTVVAGLLTHWFGLALGPLGKVIIATKNTLSAESFVITVEEGDYESKLTFSKTDGKVAIMEENDYSTSLIYDGKEYFLRNDDDDAYASIYDNNEIDDIFDSLENMEDEEEVDWEEIVEKLSIEGYVEADQVEEFMDVFNKKLKNKKWLEDNMGFEKKGNTISLSIDLGDLYTEIIDMADECDVLKESKKTYMEFAEELENIKIEVEFVVEKNKLASVEMKMIHEEYDEEKEIAIKFSGYGKSELSEDEIEDFIEEVEDTVEEYEKAHYCQTCGDWKSYGICWDCDYYGFDYCYGCYSYDYVYNREGTHYCSDCLYNKFSY